MKKRSKKKKSSKLDVQTARAKTRLKKQLSVIESLDSAQTASIEAVSKYSDPITDSQFKSWMINGLRRLSYKWPPRYKAFNNARVERGKYKCNICEGIFKRKEMSVDHVSPVVSVETGFTDWNNYLKGMFPRSVSGFQAICDTCHDKKTAGERELRKQYKKINNQLSEKNQLNNINKLKESK